MEQINVKMHLMPEINATDFLYTEKVLPKDSGLKTAAQIYLARKNEGPDYRSFLKILTEMLAAEMKAGRTTEETTRKTLESFFVYPDFSRISPDKKGSKELAAKLKKCIKTMEKAEDEAALFEDLDIEKVKEIAETIKKEHRSVSNSDYMYLILKKPSLITMPDAYTYMNMLINATTFDTNIYHLHRILKNINGLFLEKENGQ